MKQIHFAFSTWNKSKMWKRKGCMFYHHSITFRTLSLSPLDMKTSCFQCFSTLVLI